MKGAEQIQAALGKTVEELTPSDFGVPEGFDPDSEQIDPDFNWDSLPGKVKDVQFLISPWGGEGKPEYCGAKITIHRRLGESIWFDTADEELVGYIALSEEKVVVSGMEWVNLVAIYWRALFAAEVGWRRVF